MNRAREAMLASPKTNHEISLRGKKGKTHHGLREKNASNVTDPVGKSNRTPFSEKNGVPEERKRRSKKKKKKKKKAATYGAAVKKG